MFIPAFKSTSRTFIAPSRLISRRLWRTNFLRFQSTLKTNAPQGKKSTGIKALMKEYGFSALGIYLGLSAIDLPIFYLLVHSMGKNEIEYYENKAKQFFGFGISDEELSKKQEIDRIQAASNEAENKESKEDLSTFQVLISQFSWAEFAIAYTIHKSFIFIRLPITAAITPPIVKVLRGWGFKVGSQSLKASASIAKDNIKDFTASNPKFGSRPNQKKKWFSWFF